jgi:hypothetical protein
MRSLKDSNWCCSDDFRNMLLGNSADKSNGLPIQENVQAGIQVPRKSLRFRFEKQSLHFMSPRRFVGNLLVNPKIVKYATAWSGVSYPSRNTFYTKIHLPLFILRETGHHAETIYGGFYLYAQSLTIRFPGTKTLRLSRILLTTTLLFGGQSARIEDSKEKIPRIFRNPPPCVCCFRRESVKDG